MDPNDPNVTESARAHGYYSRTAEPPQEEAGPQGPRWLMKVRKGFLEVDPPLHQPKKKKQKENKKPRPQAEELLYRQQCDALTLRNKKAGKLRARAALANG